MDSRGAEIKVGVVVLLAAAILIYGILWIKEYRFNVQRYSVEVLFPNVGALDVGDPVSVLGVDKGEVEDISLDGGEVLVRFNLTKDVELKSDAAFTVMNIGLMGERFIAVRPGFSDEPLDTLKPAQGSYDTGIPEVMGTMGEAVDEIRQLVDVLRGTLASDTTSTDIIRTLANLEVITAQTRALLDETTPKLRTAVNDLKATSAGMRRLFDANTDKLQGTVDNLHQASGDFASISRRLDGVLADMEQITQKMESTDGTFGNLLNDRELYDSLKKTSDDLSELVEDIKKNPKKYIHLEIF